MQIKGFEEIKLSTIEHQQESLGSQPESADKKGPNKPADQSEQDLSRVSEEQNMQDMSIYDQSADRRLLAPKQSKGSAAADQPNSPMIPSGIKKQDKGDGNLTKAPVLVVDDNSFNTVAIQCLLTQFNIESDTCTDGREAVSWVKQRFHTQNDAYKLILMDYSMPELNGIEAGIKIKKFMKKYLPVDQKSYICCITAFEGKKYAKQSLLAGMDFFLRKPVFKSGMEKLLKKVGLTNEDSEDARKESQKKKNKKR